APDARARARLPEPPLRLLRDHRVDRRGERADRGGAGAPDPRRRSPAGAARDRLPLVRPRPDPRAPDGAPPSRPGGEGGDRRGERGAAARSRDAARAQPRALSQPVSSAGGPRTQAIVGAAVIDGRGGAPISRGVILIEDGVIAKVGTEAATSVPRDAAVIDLDGLYLLP